MKKEYQLTAPQLFATAHGRKLNPGPYRCWYCGGSCDEKYPAELIVKPTCTVRQYVAAPDSLYVCVGCIEAFNERAQIQVVGESILRGVPDHPEKPKPQKVRGYSWVITGSEAIAATKAHLVWLQETCLHPPDPPFAICLTDSGKKHLIYLAPIVVDRNHVSLVLEDRPINYSTEELGEAVTLTTDLVRAVGKKALAAEPDFGFYRQVEDHFGDLSKAQMWADHRNHDVYRLAVWLTPGKKKKGEDRELTANKQS